MKFLRYTLNEITKPAIEKGNITYDISSLISDINPNTIEKLSTYSFDTDHLPKVEQYDRIEPPVDRVGKLICIGLNYSDHAKETGAELPKEPVVFMKATSSIIGPYDKVEIPRNSTKTDWEVELGVIIGREAKYIKKEEAYHHIAGFTIVNDVSEREFQMERCGQWTKGKSHDTFSPIGPYLVTKDEVGDENNLSLTLRVDDKIYQNGNSKTMHFKVPFLISYLSQFMSLQPGDVISTGTPPGVGLGQKPPVYLKAGQTMKLSIEKLGTQEQITVQNK